MQTRREKNLFKRSRKLRSLIAAVSATTVIAGGAYIGYAKYGIPDWAARPVAQAQASASEEEYVPHKVERKPIQTNPVSVTPVYSTASIPANDETAESVANKNTAENTQDIPDAIARQGSFNFTYYEGGIYKIYCKDGYLTDIQLQPGEKITTILGGDTARWMVDKAQAGTSKGEQWHVYVKPLKAGLRTNFIINTDRHSYQIQVESTNWYTPIVGWVYPEEAAAIYRAEQDKEKESVTFSFASPEQLNFNYKIERKKFRWTPQQVFDDGCKTYLQMPKSMSSDEAPALLLKDRKGKLQVVNYRVKNNCYVVDRLFDEAVLKVGKDSVVIKRK